MVGAVVAAPTPEVVVEAGGSIRNQAIAEQLADRIIPAIEARLAELAESGAG
jgi:riboflavin biosynthesis pyrimidine reductase